MILIFTNKLSHRQGPPGEPLGHHQHRFETGNHMPSGKRCLQRFEICRQDLDGAVGSRVAKLARQQM
jgi:hypothetical protein